MKTLYSPETMQREKKHVRSARIAAALLAAAALVLCILLCFGVRTANAEERRLTVILITALSGWGVILLIRGIILPETRELRHEEGILLGIWDASANRFYPEEPEIHSGKILSVSEEFRIPKSISFCTVTLLEKNEEARLRLNARFLRTFPAAGTVIHAQTVRKYITEYEVDADA